MQTAVDTNLLIILLRGKPAAQAQLVAETLLEYDRQGRLVICPAVWAELRVLISEQKLTSFLKDNRIVIDWEVPPDVWAAAAEAFAWYLQRRRSAGALYYCACGQEISPACPQCGRPQGFPRHILPDFLIGAHALHRANLLLTADKGIPGRYFPELKVINPLDKPLS
ncbi:hypothetical protein EDD75_1307 [Thermodesulfitimonas autotrophica]|uniref:PIN domain-containing protein n=1 Tax=Thermodesulfitimonas autotrophica TaxID=1894989 RepID=A0A3N5AP87_9THEO|nr:type II toxin-antitoxin system VapC family toxin [Thermodesulfitimonas autotrophica]RPF47036.1 hypothetical protein EDD75_1307 [Thermodesulfitimonas autotrophica]